MMKVTKAGGRVTLEMSDEEYRVLTGMFSALIHEAENVNWDYAADSDVTLEAVEKLIDSWADPAGRQVAGV